MNRTELVSGLGRGKSAEHLLESSTLSAPVVEVIAALRLATGELGPAYLVGGFPRDRLLGRSVLDLDLVVKGDPVPLAEALAARLGGRVRAHAPFRTAELVTSLGLRIDLAGSRTETYAAPGALPSVVPGSLADDVRRRDFTVNTLLLEIHGEREACLYDPAGGLADLEQGLLRILHPQSFQDDPTRVLRGLRFAARLDFELEPETAELARRELLGDGLAVLSSSRLRAELRRLFASPALAAGALDRLASLGGGEAVSRLVPGLSWTGEERREFFAGVAARRQVRSWATGEATDDGPWIVWFATACQAIDDAERCRIARRLALDRPQRGLFVEQAGRAASLAGALDDEGLAPHRVSELLAPMSLDGLALVLAPSGAVARAWIRREIVDLRPLRLQVQAKDLIHAGARPGPALGEALAAVRRARLDGEIAADAELTFGLRHLGLPLGKGGARSRAALLALLPAVLFWGLLALAASGRLEAAQSPSDEPSDDLRSRVLARLDCYNDFGRREVTLFANGTARLREGSPQDLSMRLIDLAGGELESFVSRFEDGDLSETQERTFSVDGAWVERCDLEVRRRGAVESYSFGRYDSLSLDLSRIVRAVEDLGTLVEERSWTGGLDASYEPEIGDVLERRDGTLYRIVGYSADGSGVELQGEDDPLVLWVSKDSLRFEFVERVDPE